MPSKDYKKIAFYPNWKIFSQKFIRWNAELDKQKNFFDIMGTLKNKSYTARGVLPEKFGRGVRPASQNPYPINGQNLRFSLPYLWPDQKFDALFMTWLLDH